MTSVGEHPLFMSTKVKFDVAGGIRASVEQTLERLRRDRVDLVQLHGNSYTV